MADSDNANGSSSGNLSAIELARAALTTVGELTGYRPEAATGLEWDGESWCITVEALELAKIPNTTDILGTYEVRLDGHGTLRGYKRVRRFMRGEAGDAQ
jgi:Gas vesicle synthesis protein GvpO